MSSPAAPTAFTRNIFRRFGRNRRGSAAVEFALVAPVFIALLFAIFETAIMFFASQVLETVAQNSARQVLTGQAQGAGYKTWANFRDNVVCPQIPALLTCANVYVDVESTSQFSTATVTNPINSCNFDPSGFGYNPGGPTSTVTVTLYYQWPLFVTGLGYNMSNLCGSSTRVLQATAAFQTEPYQ
jgi:Flp pilus assembly protein TadG